MSNEVLFWMILALGFQVDARVCETRGKSLGSAINLLISAGLGAVALVTYLTSL